ncbi:MAG: ribosomal protein [Belnapia sp.]|jgi:large subunit ribosomal protein L20|nr:ribosomal protein [Belnapia sp.]
MARVKRGVTAHARHKKILKLAKGYVGRSGTNFRPALERVEKALQYAYRDRRNKKRDFRGLWIQRINAACREHGLPYSQFIAGIKAAGIEIDRKVMAAIAFDDPTSFATLVEKARAARPDRHAPATPFQAAAPAA